MAMRYELSDTAWNAVADLFTESSRRGRPRVDDRLMANAVLWVLCSGATWRELPEHFGPWTTAYQRFRDWRNRGVLRQMLARLNIEPGRQDACRLPAPRPIDISQPSVEICTNLGTLHD